MRPDAAGRPKCNVKCTNCVSLQRCSETESVSKKPSPLEKNDPQRALLQITNNRKLALGCWGVGFLLFGFFFGWLLGLLYKLVNCVAYYGEQYESIAEVFKATTSASSYVRTWMQSSFILSLLRAYLYPLYIVRHAYFVLLKLYSAQLAVLVIHDIRISKDICF